MKIRRSDSVEITTRHRVFKQMLQEKGISYRKAGKIIGKSDSFISQLANGRADFPEGEKLETLIKSLFDIKTKSFNERVRLFKVKMTPLEEIIELIERLPSSKVEMTLNFIKTIS